MLHHFLFVNWKIQFIRTSSHPTYQQKRKSHYFWFCFLMFFRMEICVFHRWIFFRLFHIFFLKNQNYFLMETGGKEKNKWYINLNDFLFSEKNQRLKLYMIRIISVWNYVVTVYRQFIKCGARLGFLFEEKLLHFVKNVDHVSLSDLSLFRFNLFLYIWVGFWCLFI